MIKLFTMKFNQYIDSPFLCSISFNILIDALKEIAATDSANYRVEYAKSLVNETEKIPELYSGFTDYKIIEENKDLIHNLLSDLFPTALTKNEIKAISLPFQNFIFNKTERFKVILEEAGLNDEIFIHDLDPQDNYVMSCCMILQKYYHVEMDSALPIHYEFPNKEGINCYYKINYNADFIEMIPMENAVEITEKDIQLLKDNFQDLELWKHYFPKNSWLLKGFGIITLIDVTVDNAISKLKSSLIKTNPSSLDAEESLNAIFQSIFKLPSIKMGVISFDQNGNLMSLPENIELKSYGVEQKEDQERIMLHADFFNAMVASKKYIVITSITALQEVPKYQEMVSYFLNKNIRSLILSPMFQNNQLRGVIEYVSPRDYDFNSINSKKIERFLPFIEETSERIYQMISNQIESIIQKEFTSIHKSVYWRFLEEAGNFQDSQMEGKVYNFKEIVFKNVYPLYGGADIKSSTYLRNKATQADLQKQLADLLHILSMDTSKQNVLLIEQRILKLEKWYSSTSKLVNSSLEREINSYIIEKIHPYLRSNIKDSDLGRLIFEYFNKIDSDAEVYYFERKKFDSAVQRVNAKLAQIIDYRQLDAQNIFPHYYERFVSDGLEYNMYIGSSINPNQLFDKLYVSNLRFWQLQVMCEMLRNVDLMQPELPFPIEITSLILVYTDPISIKFRMDEKRFDIEGSFNAAYEALKKRLDKAYVKNTQQRIVSSQKITIVYTSQEDEQEYLQFINFLKHCQVVEDDLEFLEVEELQGGINGLKAMRVSVNNKLDQPIFFKYNTFLKGMDE